MHLQINLENYSLTSRYNYTRPSLALSSCACFSRHGLLATITAWMQYAPEANHFELNGRMQQAHAFARPVDTGQGGVRQE